ncbi:hypothetical protein B0H11DRAFT_1906856 [Mycena galericulata]|nr:hypothetical protein B0H11DRAFT_1906856 [Mycena galericulata]
MFPAARLAVEGASLLQTGGTRDHQSTNGGDVFWRTRHGVQCNAQLATMRSSGCAKRCAYSVRITVRLRIGGLRSSNKVAMEGAALPRRAGKGGTATRLREEHASRPEKGRGAWGVHTRTERGNVGKRVRSWRMDPYPSSAKMETLARDGELTFLHPAPHFTNWAPKYLEAKDRLPSSGKIAVGGATLPRIQDVKRGGRSDAFRRKSDRKYRRRDGVTRCEEESRCRWRESGDRVIGSDSDVALRVVQRARAACFFPPAG